MELDNVKATEYEYETQFFGFTPESFVDGGRFCIWFLSAIAIEGDDLSRYKSI